MDSGGRRQHTPGRPHLIYVNGDFHSDHATTAERAAALPAAARAGKVTTVDWIPDGQAGPGWGNQVPVPDGHARVTRALCWLPGGPPGDPADWTYVRAAGPGSWREIRIDRLFGRVGLMRITEHPGPGEPA